MGISYGEGIRSIQSFWEDAYISGWLDECVLVITYSDIVSKDENEAVLSISKFKGIECFSYKEQTGAITAIGFHCLAF